MHSSQILAHLGLSVKLPPRYKMCFQPSLLIVLITNSYLMSSENPNATCFG